MQTYHYIAGIGQEPATVPNSRLLEYADMVKPNIGFRTVMQDEGWRQSWRAIVSGKFVDSSQDSLLFYDPPGSTLEVYSTDGHGGMALVQSGSGWGTTWTHVVPGRFAHGGFDGLLLYDRAAGLGVFHVCDGQGNFAVLRAHTDWNTTWDIIATISGPTGPTRLLFYNRGSGQGEFYTTDGYGGMVLQQRHVGWRTTWRQIIALQIGSKTLLLFHEGTSGHAELYSLNNSGDIQLVRSYEGWRSGWKSIQPLDLKSSTVTGLVFYDRSAGKAELWTIDGTGNTMRVKAYANWRHSWNLIVPGAFGGVYEDLLLYDRSVGQGVILSLDSWPMAPLEGYLSQESVVPDQALTVHVRSTVGPYRIQVLRRGLADVVVADVGIFPDVPVDLPLDIPENGCNWPATTELVISSGSLSGLYIVRLSSLDGGATVDIPFVVVAEAPGAGSRILFAIPSSTYEAYSWWGGRSLYGSGVMQKLVWGGPPAYQVSPQRPYLSPDDFEKPKFQYWELPFIHWLERNSVVVDYCTSNELHTDAALLSNYDLVVTVGHDEYWSWEMRDNVEQFAAQGGTVAVLSGNSVWWQIRFDEWPAITCYKDAELDPVGDDPARRSRLTVNWINSVLGRPETQMTGVSYQFGTLIHGDGISDAPVFEVVRQDPLLAGTGLGVGDTFGTFVDDIGRRRPWKDGWRTVIGYECDCRPTPGSGQIPAGEVGPLNPNWRSAWDLIVASNPSSGGSNDLLFYDRSVGEGELHHIGGGALGLKKFHQGWRSSWHAIIRGAFGNSGFGGLLFYDRNAGVAEFYALTAAGEISLLQTQDFWRQSWDLIVPGKFGGDGHTDLLLYDRVAGQGEFYATGGAGGIALIASHDGWRQSWDIIVPGNFGGNIQTDLLLYDRSGGVGEFYGVHSGQIQLLQSHSGWRSSWDIILPLQLGLPHTALLFYDRTAGTGEIYATNGAGDISLLMAYTDWRTTWKQIVTIHVNGDGTYLLFYEAGSGYAELYGVAATGGLSFIRSYGDRAFTLVARSIFRQPLDSAETEPREYASFGRLRIGEGQVISMSTTDWSFGLSQQSDAWSAIDQITANLFHLHGSGPQIMRQLSVSDRPRVTEQPVDDGVSQGGFTDVVVRVIDG